MLKCILFIFVASLTAVAATPDPELVQKVADSKQWHRLLHMRHSLPFGLYRSYVDGPEYFFAEDGHKNPKAELEASVAAFSKDLKIGKLKQHPQCAFPERFRFVKEALKLDIPAVKCEKLEEFLGRFNANSVTLIFSSAYPNNPSSMFGHTFLRINAKTEKETKHDILDYGLNFAAWVSDDENPFAFIWFGLTGGYIGQFSMLPYYTKVNEYSNAESRDIWEYDLDFSPEETRRLLSHVWELETTSYFDYYFFDENCSFYLMKILEVAKPTWDLGEFVFHAVPGETVKRVTDIPGAVREVKYRPSQRKRMVQQVEALSDEQRAEFSTILNHEKLVAEASDPQVLDAVTAFLYYEKQKAEGKQSDRNKGLQKTVLARRSQLGTFLRAPAGANEIVGETRPDLGHHAYRVGANSGVLGRAGGSGRFFQELHFKFAYHDLMNNDLGFSPYAHVNFPNLTLRYTPELNRLNVENVELLAVTSLFPLGFLEQRLSWKFVLEYATPKDLNCVDCHLLHAEGGVGATLPLGSPRHVLYALALASADAGSVLRKGYRLGPKLEVAALFNPLRPYKMRLGGNVFFDLFQSDRRSQYFQWVFENAYSFSREWEARAGVLYTERSQFNDADNTEIKFSLNYYF